MPPPLGSHIVPFGSHGGGSGGGQQLGWPGAHPHDAGSDTQGSWHVSGSVGSAHGGGGGGGHIPPADGPVEPFGPVGPDGSQDGGGHWPLESHMQYGSVGSAHGGGGGGTQFGSPGWQNGGGGGGGGTQFGSVAGSHGGGGGGQLAPEGSVHGGGGGGTQPGSVVGSHGGGGGGQFAPEGSAHGGGGGGGSQPGSLGPPEPPLEPPPWPGSVDPQPIPPMSNGSVGWQTWKVRSDSEPAPFARTWRTPLVVSTSSR